MTAKHLSFLLVAICSVLPLASCRSPWGASLGRASDYLSAEAAGSISGLAMNLSYDHEYDDGPGCSYAGRVNDKVYSVGVNLQRIDPRTAAEHEAAHREVSSKYGATEDVGGLGDSAHYVTLGRPYNEPDRTYSLYVRAGSAAFQLTADSVRDPADVRVQLTREANAILSRLANK